MRQSKSINNISVSAIVVTFLSVLGVNTSSAHGFQTFFGEDLNVGPNGNTPLTQFPNASQTEASFLSNLSNNVGTETFESFTFGQPAPLTLNFSGAGNATLTGSGAINTRGSIDSNPGGAYPVNSDKNWLTFIGNGGFSANFDNPIAALGFYLSDLETTQLGLKLTLANGNTQTLTVPNSTFPTAGSGSVLYYGLIAENVNELITDVSFVFPNGISGDGVGLDNLTIGSFNQVTVSTPEPFSVLGLFGFSLLGVTSMKRKKT
ncbi:MAG: PEP-CTERM sorting domain-containing protein [Sphaerospermopsis sp. SIO1G1]|nr:PEP-CTERM sorting domain-containing protein [Sphaerospermopsis sp. SIO1G1]